MGTRALIHFGNEAAKLCTIYRQFDGYPDGLGYAGEVLFDGPVGDYDPHRTGSSS